MIFPETKTNVKKKYRLVVEGNNHKLFDETGYQLHPSEYPEKLVVESFKSKQEIDKEEATERAINSVPPFAL